MSARIAQALERIAKALEAQNAALSPSDAPPCPHDQDAWEDLSTMGHARGRCTKCGFSVGMET